MHSQEEKDKAYKLALQENKALKDRVRKSVLTSHALLENAILKFNDAENSKVNWNDLKAFPLNTWVEIFEGVHAKKYIDTGNVIEFLTKMKPKTKFLWHEHEDCIEEVGVLVGELYEVVTGVTYVEGETVLYPPKFVHTPTNTGDIENLLKVVFTKIK